MKMPHRHHSRRFIMLFLAVGLLAAAVISFTLGRYPISPAELFRTVIGGFLNNFFNAGIELDGTTEKVLWNIRLPRILLACLVGGCLSAAGAAYQGIFQNPMAAPDILGASSGACFGAALAILLGRSASGIVAFAFISSLCTVLLVVFISGHTRGKKVLGLILSGIMISSLFSAGTSFIKLVADPSDQLPQITFWLMGSLSGVKNSTLAFAVIPMLSGLAALFLLRWRINILTLGDDEAHTLGVNVKSLRFIVIFCSTLITAASVAVSGMIGWVGLVIPNLSRRLVGSDYKYLMPVSIILGALFLLIVDDAARNLFAAEIPIGILTAFIGAPFFIVMLTGEGEKY